MSVAYTVRIDEVKYSKLMELAKDNKRSKAFYINEALDDYLFDCQEADIALERMNNSDDKVISTDEMLDILNKNKNDV